MEAIQGYFKVDGSCSGGLKSNSQPSGGIVLFDNAFEAATSTSAGAISIQVFPPDLASNSTTGDIIFTPLAGNSGFSCRSGLHFYLGIWPLIAATPNNSFDRSTNRLIFHRQLGRAAAEGASRILALGTDSS